MPLEGFEPPTCSLEPSCSSIELQGHGGGTGTRTLDILLAKQTLFQLSYTPIGCVWFLYKRHWKPATLILHITTESVLVNGARRLPASHASCAEKDSNLHPTDP